MDINKTGRFRAMYIAAMAVIIIGILGTLIVPKAHAEATSPGDVRSDAGKYVLKVTKERLSRKAISALVLKF